MKLLYTNLNSDQKQVEISGELIEEVVIAPRDVLDDFCRDYIIIGYTLVFNNEAGLKRIYSTAFNTLISRS